MRVYDFEGLNLSRATFAYHTEQEMLTFARAGCPDETKSAEAELMDWADDIAYSVHDLEDFYRAGMIPWLKLITEDEEVEQVVCTAVKAWWGSSPAEGEKNKRMAEAAARVIDVVPTEMRARYGGAFQQEPPYASGHRSSLAVTLPKVSDCACPLPKTREQLRSCLTTRMKFVS